MRRRRTEVTVEIRKVSLKRAIIRVGWLACKHIYMMMTEVHRPINILDLFFSIMFNDSLMNC